MTTRTIEETNQKLQTAEEFLAATRSRPERANSERSKEQKGHKMKKQTVNDLLIHRITKDDPNFDHSKNAVTDVYWSQREIAFRDELGLLWIDDVEANEYYCSADDPQPDEDQVFVFNDSLQIWLSLTDPRGEWYRLTRADGTEETFILVSASMQHDPYQRELTVVGEIPEGEWFVAEPTPYFPKAILC